MLAQKLPIIGDNLTISDCCAALKESFKNRLKQIDFQNTLSKSIQTKHLFFFSSGIASFYAALSILKQFSKKREIILPAYTAPSLVVAVKQIGLEAKLCDISLDDFNLDVDRLADIVNERTLAIVGVHMFGLPMSGLSKLKDNFKDVYLIEDCAQSFGSLIDNLPVGNLGDFSFFSFNRGKNFPLLQGGCLATDNDNLAGRINSAYNTDCFRGSFRNLIDFIKGLAFVSATNPYVYKTFYPLIARFKDVAPPKEVAIGQMSLFCEELGEIFSTRINVSLMQRFNNAAFLMSRLKDTEGLKLPKIEKNLSPIFNRFPILFDSGREREKIEMELSLLGVECSRMYLRPLHHIFDLGYKREEFSNANKFAENLLVFPVHPLVKEKHLSLIIMVLKEKLSNEL
jgi:dTDP-4-amino-4,6-dideoxygalactose transaminase